MFVSELFFFQSIRQGRGNLGFYVIHGREINSVTAVAGRYTFQRSLRSDIRSSGHMHHLQRVFGVQLYLTVDESEDQDTYKSDPHDYGAIRVPGCLTLRQSHLGLHLPTTRDKSSKEAFYIRAKPNVSPKQKTISNLQFSCSVNIIFRNLDFQIKEVSNQNLVFIKIILP